MNSPMENVQNTQNTQNAQRASWWQALPNQDNKQIQCLLCPHECVLENNARGRCFVRQNKDGELLLTTFGRATHFCLEPIEKVPFFHFYPGQTVLSFGTAGCNLSCKPCVHSNVAHAPLIDAKTDNVTPEGIANAAFAYDASTVVFNQNEPIVFAEYAMETAEACRERGIFTACATSAFIHLKAARAFFSRMNAVNVSLKSFSDDFYKSECGGQLAPVLDVLAHLKHESACHLEINTLLIAGKNDSVKELSALATFIYQELGAEVPLTFSVENARQHGEITSTHCLFLARKIAKECGLNYVYSSNAKDSDASSTFCPSCEALLIERENLQIKQLELAKDGKCPHCHQKIAGHFGALAKKKKLVQRFPIQIIRR